MNMSEPLMQHDDEVSEKIKTIELELFKFKTLIVAVLEEEVEEDHFVVEDKEEEMCQVKIQVHSKEEEEELVEVTMEEEEVVSGHLLSLDDTTYKLIGVDYPGNRAEDVKNPGLLWMTGFLFVVSFIGLFSLVPLRKVMVMNSKLIYPSGTTTTQNLELRLQGSKYAVLGNNKTSNISGEQKEQDMIFLKDGIPSWFAASGYVGLTSISTFIMPKNLSTLQVIGLFIVASLVGPDGGVVAGLASCGVIMSIVSTSADLMQDFKTGYLTLSSTKSIWSPDSLYKVPFAVIYREMAILGVEGFSELPKHCLAICCGFFVAALVINLLRDITPPKFSRLIPLPMAEAVPFYLGAYFAIDMFVGTVILSVWERLNRKSAKDYSGAVASGLICGDGIWTIPSAVLSIMRIDPPICMSFRPSSISSS
ncbi:hypothetical protein POM88_043835 [Heracleum sosnowskyi]|uniref:Uncharacterized protein n=1 Tax=Heracleum sosnowskyi TaxID=360622 RepID=A0AAD8H2N7_9APIA|nr:hypothetical protein POM88_043835 [Heracleum sosnowskyi]